MVNRSRVLGSLGIERWSHNTSIESEREKVLKISRVNGRERKNADIETHRARLTDRQRKRDREKELEREKRERNRECEIERDKERDRERAR